MFNLQYLSEHESYSKAEDTLEIVQTVNNNFQHNFQEIFKVQTVTNF